MLWADVGSLYHCQIDSGSFSCRDRLICSLFRLINLEVGEQVFAYRRVLGDEALTVVLNFSEKEAVVSHRGEPAAGGKDPYTTAR